MKYWLMKSEPTCYSIDDLEQDGTTFWDGVRNYQARNLMRDEMAVGDLVLFYHSNAEPPGVAGLAQITRTAYPDATAWDEKEKHFDPRSSPDRPIWVGVEISFTEKFPRLLSLSELKTYPELSDMLLLKKGTRLSVQPVSKKAFTFICHLTKAPL